VYWFAALRIKKWMEKDVNLTRIKDHKNMEIIIVSASENLMYSCQIWLHIPRIPSALINFALLSLWMRGAQHCSIDHAFSFHARISSSWSRGADTHPPARSQVPTYSHSPLQNRTPLYLRAHKNFPLLCLVKEQKEQGKSPGYSSH
jgi:hypothetical protein